MLFTERSQAIHQMLMIDYLDPYRGTPALQKLLCLCHQNGLVTGAYGAALALGGVALGSRRLQGQVHGLVAVQAVGGVVHPSPILWPRGYPLGPAVVVRVLRGFRAALRRDGDQRLGSGTRGYWRWRFLVTCVSYSYGKNAKEKKKKAERKERKAREKSRLICWKLDNRNHLKIVLLKNYNGVT